MRPSRFPVLWFFVLTYALHGVGQWVHFFEVNPTRRVESREEPHAERGEYGTAPRWNVGSTRLYSRRSAWGCRQSAAIVRSILAIVKVFCG